MIARIEYTKVLGWIVDIESFTGDVWGRNRDLPLMDLHKQFLLLEDWEVGQILGGN